MSIAVMGKKKPLQVSGAVFVSKRYLLEELHNRLALLIRLGEHRSTGL